MHPTLMNIDTSVGVHHTPLPLRINTQISTSSMATPMMNSENVPTTTDLSLEEPTAEGEDIQIEWGSDSESSSEDGAVPAPARIQEWIKILFEVIHALKEKTKDLADPDLDLLMGNLDLAARTIRQELKRYSRLIVQNLVLSAWQWGKMDDWKELADGDECTPIIEAEFTGMVVEFLSKVPMDTGHNTGNSLSLDRMQV
ncbi:hypothetical protein DXG01_009386, partial [Tephrocybe rancida]